MRDEDCPPLPGRAVREALAEADLHAKALCYLLGEAFQACLTTNLGITMRRRHRVPLDEVMP